MFVLLKVSHDYTWYSLWRTDLEVNTDLSKLIDQVADNRRMPREKVIERFKEILSSWATRELNLYHPLKVEFDEQEGKVEIYSSREVVGIVENEYSQIEFQEAIKIKRDANLGDILLVRVRPDLAKSLLPGVLRELYTGIREEYPRKGKTGRARQETGQVEENLDGIGEGEKGPVKPLKEFYQPFEQDVEMTKVSIGDTDKDLIPTDIICERCGSRMVIRWGNSIKTGRFGKFLACSNYPTCKFTQAIESEIRCPQKGCDGILVERRTRRGDVFCGCSNYPRCTFALWNKPISKECPQSLWNGPEISTNSSISDEGRENKVGMGKGQIIDDYRVAETYKTRNLPRIPDLPEPGTLVSISVERSEEATEVGEPEGDTRNLISILANDRSNTEANGSGKKLPPVSNNESELNTERILSEIEKVVMDNGYLQVRRNLNELEVDVIKCDSPFTIIFHIYNEIVSVRSLLPFVKGVSIDLLTLCGQADFISNVGIVLHKDKPCYAVRSTHPAKALSRSSLWEMVSQTILDASKANEIINSKKPVGK